MTLPTGWRDNWGQVPNSNSGAEDALFEDSVQPLFYFRVVLREVSEMIVSNRFVRTYLFGSKVARIHNKSFECCVSTAKEGLFQKESTLILETKIGNTTEAVPAGLRPCGKVIYSPTLRKSDRLQFHDLIAKTLDAAGEEGCTLEEALDQIFADLKRRGIAVETINLASDEVQPDAQFNLGGLYANSEGIPQGDAQITARYRKAAERGDAEAQFNLGYLYDEGKGVRQNYTQAAAWYRKAAEQGYTRAQYALGRLYRYGLGVQEDYAEACFWSDIAAAGKLDISLAEFTAKYVDKAASYMTPADFARFQQRVRKWFESHQAKPQ